MATFRVSYVGKGGAVLLALIVLCCVVAADSDYDNKWAVLIGVTNYQYIEDLDFPGNDVDDMRSVLVNNCGFPSSHVFAYKDSQAKKSAIRGAISQLSSRTGSNDLVVFYFSGHGTYRQLLDAAPIDESDGYEETLCPYDALDNSFANDITDDELQTWLTSVSSRNTVCIIDTCGSGGMTKTTLRGNPAQPPGTVSSTDIILDDGIARDLTRDINGRKYLVLTAADDDEDSWDISALQNGLFTYFLVEGLTKASANTDNDQWISVEEAFYSARAATINYKSSQHPQITDGDTGSEVEIYPLSATPTPTSTQVINGGDITGKTVTGSLGSGGTATYSFSLPGGVSGCTVTLDGPADADFDLYIRKGSVPTTSSYDYAAFTSSADESITLSNPFFGTYYVLVKAYSGSGSFTIRETHSTATSTITPTQTPTPTNTPTVTATRTPIPTWTRRPLPWITTAATTPTSTIPVVNGGDITGKTVSGSLGSGGTATYSFVLPVGVSSCTVTMDGPGGADFDLYIRKGSAPTTSTYDYKAFTSSADEAITITDPSSGTYYVLVKAYSGSGSFTIREMHVTGVAPTMTQVTNTGDITGRTVRGSLGSGGAASYYFDLPGGVTNCAVTLDGPSGTDFDLYIRKGSAPTTSTCDYKSTSSRADESCSLANPASGRYYVLVKSDYGSGSYSITESHV